MSYAFEEMTHGGTRRHMQCVNKYIGEETIARPYRLNLIIQSQMTDVLRVAIKEKNTATLSLL
jgi:hypothetical protein